MSSKFVAAAAALTAAALTLSACQQSEENSKNAVATGETFEFITPGGQTEIRYAPEERKPLQLSLIHI